MSGDSPGSSMLLEQQIGKGKTEVRYNEWTTVHPIPGASEPEGAGARGRGGAGAHSWWKLSIFWFSALEASSSVTRGPDVVYAMIPTAAGVHGGVCIPLLGAGAVFTGQSEERE